VFHEKRRSTYAIDDATKIGEIQRSAFEEIVKVAADDRGNHRPLSLSLSIRDGARTVETMRFFCISATPLGYLCNEENTLRELTRSN